MYDVCDVCDVYDVCDVCDVYDVIMYAMNCCTGKLVNYIMTAGHTRETAGHARETAGHARETGGLTRETGGLTCETALLLDLRMFCSRELTTLAANSSSHLQREKIRVHVCLRLMLSRIWFIRNLMPYNRERE